MPKEYYIKGSWISEDEVSDAFPGLQELRELAEGDEELIEVIDNEQDNLLTKYKTRETTE